MWSPYEEHFCLPRILQIDLIFNLKTGVSNYPVSKYVSHLRQGLPLCMAPDMMGHLFLMQVSACALCVSCLVLYFFSPFTLGSGVVIPLVVYDYPNDSGLLGFRQHN